MIVRVAGNKFDNFMMEGLKSSRIEAEVISSRGPVRGPARFTVISWPTKPSHTPARKSLMDPDVDYLVLIAGVNDTRGPHRRKRVRAPHSSVSFVPRSSREFIRLYLKYRVWNQERMQEGLPRRCRAPSLWNFLFDGMKDDVIGDCIGGR